MSTRTTTLALEVVSEVDDAVSGLGKVDTYATNAAAAMDKLEAANDKAAVGLDKVTGATDALDSAGGAATGALGALASGFELIGAEDAAVALQQAGLATDFLSGVGQTAALAMQAQGAATKGLTVAQKALNIVMRANPIGLLITAGLALGVLFGVLYNKSETFRDAVQTVGRIGKAAFEAVVTAVKSVATWVGDRLPGAFEAIKKVVGLYLTPPKVAFGLIRDAVEAVHEWVGKIPAKFGDLKDKAAEIAAPLLAPFTAVKDAIDWIIDKLANIKIPDWFNKIPGVGRMVSSDPYGGDAPMVESPFGRSAGAQQPTPTVSIVVQGALDPYAVAQQIRDVLARYNLAVS